MRSGAIRAVVASILVAVLGTAGGCGVSASTPEDHGDRLQAVPPFDDEVLPVPRPNDARSTEGLVELFLSAAVGGGEPAIGQVRAFLTANADAAFRYPADPQQAQPTVVRVVGDPTAGVATGQRTPVTVTYQVIGLLNDQGRVDELSQPAGGTMVFWVVTDEENRSNLRIDQIDNAPPGLLLSDAALGEIYRIQPIYFWDAQAELLVPDLRYLPLTLGEEQRANLLVQWLVAGPSPWLTGARRVPSGTSKESVVIRADETFVVNLALEAERSADTLNQLLYQLRWTLGVGQSFRKVELQIDGQAQQLDTGDRFREFNRSYTFSEPKPRYDIVNDKVEVVSASGAAVPEVLASPDNAGVTFASVNRNATVAALVRSNADGRRYLQFVRSGVQSVTADISPRADMTRPSWVPVPGEEDEYVMLAAGGHLYLVSTTDGRSTDVTPSRVGAVSTATVAPDGRRVAFVAGGDAYVASLTVEGETMAVGSNLRPILAGQKVSGVAWINETWLYLGGTPGGGPAMWKVSADGVVAHNESANLRGINVTDVVAAPVWPSTRLADVIVYTTLGVFTFGPATTETSLRAPFFGG
jgi:hypothetical protein